jgi:protein-L-isoaspartate(D-aspartate) O-methyltransferase
MTHPIRFSFALLRGIASVLVSRLEASTIDLLNDESFFASECGYMVSQLAEQGVDDPRIVSAMTQAPRHWFVPLEVRDGVYALLKPTPLPGFVGRSALSSPLIVGVMTQALFPTPKDRVLEIGTATGWQAVVLASLVKEVYTIELDSGLAESARDRVEKLGYRNVQVFQGDGNLGLPEHAPFDAILVTAAAREVPPALLEQLALNGRLIIPVGEDPYNSLLLKITKDAAGKVLPPVSLRRVGFVPLVD